MGERLDERAWDLLTHVCNFLMNIELSQNNTFKNVWVGPGAMAQLLGILSALPEGLGSGPIIHAGDGSQTPVTQAPGIQYPYLVYTHTPLTHAC